MGMLTREALMKAALWKRRSASALHRIAGQRRDQPPTLCLPLESRQLMASVAWDGGPTGNGTDFNLPANWAGDVLPGPGDDAVLDATGSSPLITVGSSPSVRSISSSRALHLTGTLNITQASSIAALTVFGGIVNTSGSSAVVTITSSLTMSGGGFLGTGSVVLASGAVGSIPANFDIRTPLSVGNGATLNVTSGFGVNTGGSISIASGGVMNLQNSSTSSPMQVGTTASGFVSNAGTIVNTSAGRFNFNLPLTNTGLVQVSQGTIGLINTGTSTGQFDIASGRELIIESAAFAFGSGANTTGAGMLRLPTTLNVSGGVTISNLLVFGGTVNTSGSSAVVTITSSLTMSGGGFLGTGSVVLASGAIGSIPANFDIRTPLSVGNGATLNVTSGFGVNTGGSISIASGGVMNITNSSSVSPLAITFTGAGTIANAGTFTKLGAGIFFVNIPVSNTGLLDVQGGRLDLNAGVTSISSGVLNSGAWRTSGGTLAGTIAGFTTIGAAASVDLTGTGSFPAMDVRTNNGTLTLRGGTQITTASLVNNGVIDVAPNANIFSSGTFTQTASGTFRTTLAGTSTSGYGRIGAVNGSTLNGTLDIRRDPSFTPPLDSTFSVVTGNPRAGQFASVLLPADFEAFKRFSLTYTSTAANVRYSYQSGVWTGAAGTPLWSNPGNWSNNTLPGATDDVIVPASSQGTATTADGPSWSVRSVTSEKAFSVDSDFTTSAPSFVQAGVSMSLTNSASLNGSDWNFVNGSIFVLGTNVRITGGNIRTTVSLAPSLAGSPRLTLSGTAQPDAVVLNAPGAQLDLADGYQLRTVVSNSSNGPAGSRSINFLGATGVVTSSGGIIDNATANLDQLVVNAATLISSGTIRSDRDLRIDAGEFQNLGLISTGYFNNRLIVNANFTNQSGTVRLAPGSNLIIAGDFDAAPGMGTWDSASGFVVVTGTIRDAIFSLTSNYGFWALDENGVLDSCDITPVDTALESYGVGGTLLDTDYNGTLIVSAGDFALQGKTNVNAVNVIGSGTLTLVDTVVDYPIVVGGAASGAAALFTIRFQTSTSSPLLISSAGSIIYQTTPGAAALSLTGVGTDVPVALAGTFLMQDPSAGFEVASSINFHADPGSLVKAERGTLSIANTSSIDASGSLQSGTWEVGDGVLATPGKTVLNIKQSAAITLSGNGSWSQMTTLNRNDGTFTILAPLAIAPAGASFTNNATIRVGSSGSLSMGANFAMTAGSVLLIEAESPLQAGSLNVFSAFFTTSSAVQIVSVGGYSPQRFDDITFLTSVNGIIGSPDSVSLPSLDNPDLKPILINDASSLRFFVTSVGDLDNDGEVGFGDFLNFFNFYDSGDPAADLDADGEVGFGDFLRFFNLYDAG